MGILLLEMLAEVGPVLVFVLGRDLDPSHMRVECEEIIVIHQLVTKVVREMTVDWTLL